jgi:hypothetical protein
MSLLVFCSQADTTLPCIRFSSRETAISSGGGEGWEVSNWFHPKNVCFIASLTCRAYGVGAKDSKLKHRRQSRPWLTRKSCLSDWLGSIGLQFCSPRPVCNIFRLHKKQRSLFWFMFKFKKNWNRDICRFVLLLALLWFTRQCDWHCWVKTPSVVDAS